MSDEKKQQETGDSFTPILAQLILKMRQLKITPGPAEGGSPSSRAVPAGDAPLSMGGFMANKEIRVLIIEDDPEDVEIVRICLDEPESMGMRFALEHADRLEGGLQRLRDAAYDALLLDLTLPDSQGVETLLRVLSECRGLPVLVMTNLGDESLALEAMRLGAQDYIVKTTSDSRVLKRAIWYAIERRKLLSQSETIIMKAPDAMTVVDTSGLVQYLNPAAETLFGMRAQAMLGQPFPYAVAPGDACRLSIPAPGGGLKTGEMRVTEIEWRGSPALLASIRDITELQKLEQLKAEIKERRKVDQLKDNLLATVSHELRTPLIIVKGAIDNLDQGIAGPMTPKQQQIVTIAHRNLARLTRMIDNLLDLSRLESGHAKILLRRFAPVPLIEEAVAGLGFAVQERNIPLDKQLEPGLPEVYADSDLITQVLSNLIDNALRYAKTRVTVRARPIAAPPGTEVQRSVLIEISDDGPGIPAEKKGELFSKFTQLARPKGGAGYKGTGLGLAICKEILALHGTEMTVHSVPGTKTTFSFALPIYAGQKAAHPAAESSRQE